MGKRKKTYNDYDHLGGVELSFIASCNARKLFTDPSSALSWYIGLCERTDRPRAASVASMHRSYLEDRYITWSAKNAPGQRLNVPSYDDEQAAIQFLLERGYAISKAPV